MHWENNNIYASPRIHLGGISRRTYRDDEWVATYFQSEDQTVFNKFWSRDVAKVWLEEQAKRFEQGYRLELKDDDQR